MKQTILKYLEERLEEVRRQDPMQINLAYLHGQEAAYTIAKNWLNSQPPSPQLSAEEIEKAAAELAHQRNPTKSEAEFAADENLRDIYGNYMRYISEQAFERSAYIDGFKDGRIFASQSKPQEETEGKQWAYLVVNPDTQRINGAFTTAEAAEKYAHGSQYYVHAIKVFGSATKPKFTLQDFFDGIRQTSLEAREWWDRHCSQDENRELYGKYKVDHLTDEVLINIYLEEKDNYGAGAPNRRKETSDREKEGGGR